MIEGIICGFIFAVGHLVRDGWPPFKENLQRIGAPAWVVSLSTHFARWTGAFVCGVGVNFVYGNWHLATVVGLAILAGFYTDTKHGEGQQAGHGPNPWWVDVGYLLLSGVTSVVPLTALCLYSSGDWTALSVALLGVAKPPVWFLAWWLLPNSGNRWLSPTRLAAMGFGGVIGAVIGAPV